MDLGYACAALLSRGLMVGLLMVTGLSWGCEDARRCNADADCNQGLSCDPGTRTCERASEASDAGGDASAPDHEIYARIDCPPGAVVGTLTSFSGQESSDEYGHTLSFEWNFGTGFEAGPADVQHTFDHAGGVEVWLRVTDELGAADMTDCWLEVAPVDAPTVQILSPLHDLQVFLGEATVVEVQATPSNGRSISYVTLTLDGTEVATGRTAPYTLSFTWDAVPGAEAALLALAMDSEGAIGRSTARTLTMRANTP